MNLTTVYIKQAEYISRLIVLYQNRAGVAHQMACVDFIKVSTLAEVLSAETP